MTEEKVPANIYEAVAAIMNKVGYVQKQRAANLNYSYAGEAALIEAIRPWMVEYGVIMYVSEYSELLQTPYRSKSDTPMMNAVVRGKVVFLHAPSNTFIEAAAVGEGSDSGDKAFNKAQTGMFKYAIRQTFMIETGDDPDKDPSDQMERARVQSNGARPVKVEAVKPSTKALVDYAISKGLGQADDRDSVKALLGKILTADLLPPSEATWAACKAAVDQAAG